MKTLFIAPDNDAEGIKIQELLKRKGQEYMVTKQAWGASWDGLEDEIKEKLKDYDKVYGIELKGERPESNCIDIDHHVYYENNKSKGEQKEKSSLRQVAEILGEELTLEEQFYEANDIGYIPEMKKLGDRLGMTEEEIVIMIEQVNVDEAMAQNITMELKKEAVNAVKKGYIYDKRFIWIDLPDFRAMREVTNILYKMGRYNDMLYDTTVVDSHDSEGRVVVFGNIERKLLVNL